MSEISWKTNFTAINCFDGYIEPCLYTIDIAFNDHADNEDDQYTAFGRMRMVIKELYEDATFIHLKNPLLDILHKKFKSRIVTLPYAPSNFVIGAVTWYKMLSITQGRISIEHISVSCDKSDDLALHISEEVATSDEIVNEIAMSDWDKPAWWFRPTPTTWDVPIIKKKQVTMIYDENEWPDYLHWDKKLAIVKKKKSENNIIPLKKTWKPEVIKGDKS
jgi:hypothetical protein